MPAWLTPSHTFNTTRPKTSEECRLNVNDAPPYDNLVLHRRPAPFHHHNNYPLRSIAALIIARQFSVVVYSIDFRAGSLKYWRRSLCFEALPTMTGHYKTITITMPSIRLDFNRVPQNYAIDEEIGNDKINYRGKNDDDKHWLTVFVFG